MNLAPYLASVTVAMAVLLWIRGGSRAGLGTGDAIAMGMAAIALAILALIKSGPL